MDTNKEAEYLRQRAEAHESACADLENDLLIQATFGKPPPLKPLKTPMRPGSMTRRQAD
jgi:hypothetical protein